MKTTVIMAVLALAAAGAGAFGGMQYHEHAQTRAALMSANTELQKTQAELKTAREDLAALRKQFSEQQIAFGALQAEMANARGFVEAEKAVSARLREEMAKQKEEFAAALAKAAASRPGRQSGPMLYK